MPRFLELALVEDVLNQMALDELDNGDLNAAYLLRKKATDNAHSVHGTMYTLAIEEEEVVCVSRSTENVERYVSGAPRLCMIRVYPTQVVLEEVTGVEVYADMLARHGHQFVIEAKDQEKFF